jgi:hypothetical protein
LARFVRFAYLPSDELIDETNRIRRDVLGVPRFTTHGYGPEGPEAYYRAMQIDLRSGLEQLVAGKAWTLPPTGLSLNCHAQRFIGYTEGEFAAVFLRECATLLNGLEKSRLQKCSALGCDSVFVKRKKAKYCVVHSSVRMRSERYRDALKQRLTAAEIKKRRRRYYRNRQAKLQLEARKAKAANGRESR